MASSIHSESGGTKSPHARDELALEAPLPLSGAML
jgi:hypothetical protein